MKPANLIAESEVYMKNVEIKMGVYKVISIAAKNHGQAFSSWLLASQYEAPAELLPTSRRPDDHHAEPPVHGASLGADGGARDDSRKGV